MTTGPTVLCVIHDLSHEATITEVNGNRFGYWFYFDGPAPADLVVGRRCRSSFTVELLP